MKKITLIITILTLVVLLALVFTGCAKMKAEKKLLEAGEFVGATGGEYNDQISLSIKKDKSYILNDYSYEDDEIKTYEGKWSYVMTYKYKYKYAVDPLEVIKLSERVTLYIFKLEGCVNRGKQGYFVYTGYTGKVYYTDEEVNKSHFDNQRTESGSLYIPGTDMRKNFDKIK